MGCTTSNTATAVKTETKPDTVQVKIATAVPNPVKTATAVPVNNAAVVKTVAVPVKNPVAAVPNRVNEVEERKKEMLRAMYLAAALNRDRDACFNNKNRQTSRFAL